MALLLPRYRTLRRFTTQHIEQSKAFIQQSIEENPDASVMWSAGKDSTVTLMLAYEVNPKIKVYFIDDHEHDETYRYIDQMVKRYNLNLHRIFQQAVFIGGDTLIHWKDMTPDRIAGRVHKDFPQLNKNLLYWVITKVFPYQQQVMEDVVLTGMRGDEDMQRMFLKDTEERIRLPLLIDKLVEYNTISRSAKAYAKHPILDWSERDVHDFLDTHGIPKNPLYSMGYRSIGDRFTTRPNMASERGGRQQDLETIMFLAKVGYLNGNTEQLIKL